MAISFDHEARRISAMLPPEGPRVVIIGSSEFWHPDSERTCVEIGRLLACLPNLVLITGGIEGIGEATGRSFFRTRRELGAEPRVYHLLPTGEEPWDYGETIFVGNDMAQRREVLARVAEVYVAVEGGPGTVHEASVAQARKAVVIPVGRSGGYAGGLYAEIQRPTLIEESTWLALGAASSTPDEAASAAVQAVKSLLDAASDRWSIPSGSLG